MGGARPRLMTLLTYIDIASESSGNLFVYLKTGEAMDSKQQDIIGIKKTELMKM